ncbi:iron ABC transporter permease [Moorella naiadis]|uniref:FecCD family ABC transporter permease n=1 Tax=Moorella naiadis (nom. illeg.) TaxID=3093670 RepID=UPI003D9CA55A
MMHSRMAGKNATGDAEGDFYARLASHKILTIILLSLALAVALAVSLGLGSANISFQELWQVIKGAVTTSSGQEAGNKLARTVILNLRLPRVLLATLAGCSLAGAGVMMQGILRNPLADPYILGISAGASFGAALAVVLGLGKLAGFTLAKGYIVVACAFTFGLLTTFVIYGLASLRSLAPETLILAGVALGYLFSAGVSLLKYLSSHEELRELTLWLMGGLAGAKWQPLILLVPVCLAALGFLWRSSWDLNALGAGEEVAANLGVNLSRLRRNGAVGASMLASATVAFTGIIGFIGLVAPHLGRFLVGSDYRYLIPASCLLGAILLLAADTLARTVASPIEIPVGVITSLIGVPFFLSLLFRERRRWWS